MKQDITKFDNHIYQIDGPYLNYKTKEIMGYPKMHRGRRKMGSKKRRARKKNKKK